MATVEPNPSDLITHMNSIDKRIIEVQLIFTDAVIVWSLTSQK